MTINLQEMSGRPKKKFIQFALDLKDISEKSRKKLKFPMYASEKFDGVFCIALKDSMEGSVTIYSRTGEVYTSMKHIEEEFKTLLYMDELVIFEAYNPTLDLGTISGHARDTKEQHPSLFAYCHDHLTLDEFTNGGGRPFKERLAYLYEGFKAHTYLNLQYVFHTPVNCGALAMAMAEFIWKDGGEGVVLKNPEGTYEGGKRNSNSIKIKQSVTYDLEIVGLKEGKGKHSGRVGAIQCRFKDGVIVDVGSGFTDLQRQMWWDDPSSVIGLIAEIKAMKDSTHGDLREATFKGIRLDKLEAEF